MIGVCQNGSFCFVFMKVPLRVTQSTHHGKHQYFSSMLPTYVPGSRIRALGGGLSVSQSSLRNWATSGKIRSLKLPGGKRLYHSGDVLDQLGGLREALGCSSCTPSSSSSDSTTTTTILYARVSSSKQKEAGDLQRQIEYLCQTHPNTKLIQDVGSGLNYKRKGLLSVLERVLQGMVRQVVVTNRDRLARFGVDMLEWLFQKHGCKLVVLDKTFCEPNNSTELSDDLLAVCNFFVAKNNGKRAGRNKRRRIEYANQAGRSENDACTNSHVEAMAGNDSLHMEPVCGFGQHSSNTSHSQGTTNQIGEQECTMGIIESLVTEHTL